MTTKNDDARAERLKAALRENLRRRKVQVRGREGAERGEGSAGPARDADRPDAQEAVARDEP